MLSTSVLGLVVVPWQKISNGALLPPSLSHPLTRSLVAPLPFGACSVHRIRANFKCTPCCSTLSPSSSSSSFRFSSCCRSWVMLIKPAAQQEQHKRRNNCRRRQLAKSILDVTSFKGGLSHRPLSALSSTSFYTSFLFYSVQQRQRRRNSRSRHQMNDTLVEAIAGTEDPLTNLNQKPLHDELQRYGIDESDYDYTTINLGQQQPNFTLDMEKHKTSSSILRKRKTTAELSGTKPQHPTLKEESGVVEDWCAYLLLSADLKKTYVGVTYDIRRRLRQHNGEIAGGAKSARAGRPWRLVCTVRGFNTRSEACQFEWTWKSTAAKIKTITQPDSKIMESPLVMRRRATLAKVLEAKEEWSYLNVEWHVE